ncbi:MAG: hypothetical protein R2690_10730 [Acidimicrobiales bacterium]
MDALTHPGTFEVGQERLVVLLGLVLEPSNSCGPRSLPPCGSIVMISTPAGALDASMMALRPWKLPISTMRSPASSSPARSHNRQAWSRVIQPWTSATER